MFQKIKNNCKTPEYNIKIYPGSTTMSNCTNLYFLSTVACQLSECMDNEEIEKLASDLIVLGYMLENIQRTSSITCHDNSKCGI